MVNLDKQRYVAELSPKLLVGILSTLLAKDDVVDFAMCAESAVLAAEALFDRLCVEVG